MNAEHHLFRIADALAEAGLEAVMIGNAAAALHGAPVTTLDVDFMFRKSPANIRKLKLVADRLHGQLLRPFYPLSGLYRLSVDETGMQFDFMSVVHGIRSFESIRSRATRMEMGDHPLWVASLADVIASKRAVGRAKDRAVLEILERTLRETEHSKKSARRIEKRK